MELPLELRIKQLIATQRELWKLEQQFADEAKRRKLTEAALEALKAASFDTRRSRSG